MFNRSYETWQTTLPDNLPTLFYAFDETQSQTERVAGFRITDQDQFKLLLDSKPERLRIHLGANPDYDSNIVPSYPAVQFFIEGLKSKGETVTLQFEWDPNPPFLEKGAYGQDSGPNEIPVDGAILFAQAWLETPYDSIRDAFEGADSRNLVQRVKSYTFQEDETASIITQLEKYTGDVQLNLYLGNSIPVTNHPFGFRPVLEVRPVPFIPAEKTKAKASKKDNNGGGGGDGSTFFDFSNPCPPVCS